MQCLVNKCSGKEICWHVVGTAESCYGWSGTSGRESVLRRNGSRKGEGVWCSGTWLNLFSTGIGSIKDPMPETT